MKVKIDNNSHEILEIMFHEFNDHTFYGLEFIMDEFRENKDSNKSNKNICDDVDWFGLA